MLVQVNKKDIYEITAVIDLAYLLEDLGEISNDEIKTWVETKCYSYKDGDNWEDYKSLYYTLTATYVMKVLREGASFSVMNYGRTSKLEVVNV